MFLDGYTTYFRKKRFFYLFEKSQIIFWGNWMRNPSSMDIFCLANYPADEVLLDVQGVLKICIHTFTSYNTKRLSHLRSMCCKIIITMFKEIKHLGMKCNKRVMKQACPNQFRLNVLKISKYDVGPWCTCYPLLYTSGYQISSKFSENVLEWLYYLFSQKKIFLFFRKISNNVLRKLDEKPKLHGYILPR